MLKGGLALCWMAAMLPSVTPAQARPVHQMTVSELQSLCAEQEPGAACRFYILGVMEGTTTASELAKDRAHFCTPSGVSQAEIVAIVKRLVGADLARFPDDATLPAVAFIGSVLMRAYPCQ